MRLRRIEIENFKGISSKQIIELKPITLLFGPNSAGKSTILQSLHYIREILDNNNPDPDEIISGGGMNLGGFANFVNNRDKTKRISIKLIIDRGDNSENKYLPMNSGNTLDSAVEPRLAINYLMGDNVNYDADSTVVHTIGLETKIAWSELNQTAFVCEVNLEMNNGHLFTIKATEPSNSSEITNFNFKHPLFQNVQDDNSDLVNALLDCSTAMASGAPQNLENYSILAKSIKGANFKLREKIEFQLNDVETKDHDNFGDYMYAYGLSFDLQNLLNELIMGPSLIISEFLGNSIYLGPLRKIPERNFDPKLSPDQSRWAYGLAAWDILHQPQNDKLLNRVSKWLEDPDRLDTGYQIKRREDKVISSEDYFHALMQRFLTEDDELSTLEEDISIIQEEYEKIESNSRLVITKEGVEASLIDVGVGISQVLPVLVACLNNVKTLISLEQPELHIHPAVQVGLGDLFIHCITQNSDLPDFAPSLLIETHSEHLMLRLLRRIRERHYDEIPPGSLGLDPRDLSVNYISNNSGKTVFENLEIDEDGDFSNNWPDGFFDERDREL